MHEVFFELTIIVFIAAVLSYSFKLLRQPSILAFVLTGIIIGPFGQLQLNGSQLIDTLAKLGITFLLFMLGLEFRIGDLTTIGKNALFVAGMQIASTFVGGYGLGVLLGFSSHEAIFIGIALVFSSTIVVLQLLSQKKDTKSLYGRLAIAVLLIQDFVAIFILMLMSSGIAGSEEFHTDLLGLWLVKTIAIFALLLLFSKSIFPKITALFARSEESLVLFSFAWLFGFCLFVSSSTIGFPIEIGGFLAGLALAQGSENVHIAAKTRLLRDLFITFFFVLLGASVSFQNITSLYIPTFVFTLFVLLVKPLFTAFATLFSGFHVRTAVLTGLHLGQISEFSLVVLYLALARGFITQEVASLATLVSILAFVFSSYTIVYANKIYNLLRPQLVFIKKGGASEIQFGRTAKDFSMLKNHVVLVGAHRIGRSILEALLAQGERVVVVDFDPNVRKTIQDEEVTVLFGDIADYEIQEKIHLSKAKLIVSTVPDIDDNLVLISYLKKRHHSAKIVLEAYDKEDAKKLYLAGADYVIIPYLIGGKHFVSLLQHGGLDKLSELAEKDKKTLGL